MMRNISEDVSNKSLWCRLLHGMLGAAQQAAPVCLCDLSHQRLMRWLLICVLLHDSPPEYTEGWENVTWSPNRTFVHQQQRRSQVPLMDRKRLQQDDELLRPSGQNGRLFRDDVLQENNLRAGGAAGQTSEEQWEAELTSWPRLSGLYTIKWFMSKGQTLRWDIKAVSI